MDTLPDPLPGSLKATGEFPAAFWKLADDSITAVDWQQAGQKALARLAGLPVKTQGVPLADIIAAIETEYQFGAGHWQLSLLRRLYYIAARPALPQAARLLLHRLLGSRHTQAPLLDWPIDDRFVRFQFETLRHLLALKGLDEVRYVPFWPEGKRFAFILTHDVETVQGQEFVRRVVELEESYGYRSCFNFVAEDYRVDLKLLDELKQRGFEIGVHGLKHDGKAFFSKASFLKQSQRINTYLEAWGVAGYRSPLTLRNPEWMQALNIAYDSSFFDNDPFETIPGGTMSIWPFNMGHFIELPYTLIQDHTLMVKLGENSPRLWLEKVDFIQRYSGMVLVNSHPDYLLDPNRLSIYESFLQNMRQRGGYWHALPGDVAMWWRGRQHMAAGIGAEGGEITTPAGQFKVSPGTIRRTGDGIELLPAASSTH